MILVDAAVLSQTRQRPRQGTRPRPAPPRKPAEEPELSPREALDLAKGAETGDERIKLLESFIASQREMTYDGEARELLMREYALKGEQQLREGDTRRALQSFRSVVRAAPGVVSDRIFGQFIFPLPMAVNAFGFRTESVELMRSIEPRFDNDPNRLVEIGFFYVQIEAPFEAVRVLEKAVALAPDNHRAHNSLGTAYLINLRADDAENEFRRALDINPKDEFANLNLANLARANGNHEMAVRFYRKQLELRPEDNEAHAGIAISLLALGRDEEAEEAINQARRLAPADYRFLTQLAYYYTSRRKPALARPLVEQAVRIEPRYAWAYIAKADIDLLESKYGDALATLISARTHGTFATLTFELSKSLMTLDGYDQALEVLGPAVTINQEGEFEMTLGGAVKARSRRLDLLLEKERKAALFLNEHPTTQMQYRLAEALVKIAHYTKVAKTSRRPAPRRQSRPAPSRARREQSEQQDLRNATRPRRAQPLPDSSGVITAELSAGADASLTGVDELMKAINTFTTLDDGRQPFRMVWVSRKLTESGVALDAAEQLARRAIAMADTATEPENSMRDAPLLDRTGRRRVFLGRAHDALGWALFKKGDVQSAVEHLTLSINSYLPSAERKQAMWHLAVAMQESGDEKRALDYYIASFDPSIPTATARRAQIEALYKKLKGSLAGLDEKLNAQ
jgi:tetratricopeptide (TPR) repeat protein